MAQEKSLEQYLKRKVENKGGLFYKFTSPGRNGVPDRIVITDQGDVYFVELKAPGKKLRPLQQKELDRINSTGAKAVWFDTKEKADRFMQEVFK